MLALGPLDFWSAGFARLPASGQESPQKGRHHVPRPDGDAARHGRDDQYGQHFLAPGWRHLEVHAFDKKTGNVVKTVMPEITVTNKVSGQAQNVPVVTMQGLADGVGDFHHGNNVLMPSGTYTVSVIVNGESANFSIAVS